jgi:hypothetical protein
MTKKVSDAVKEYMAKQKQIDFFEDFYIDGVIIKFKKNTNKSENKDKKGE